MIWKKGYGITNYAFHRMLKEMDKKERELFEKRLESSNPKKYKGFKEWQKSYVEIRPEMKIDGD